MPKFNKNMREASDVHKIVVKLFQDYKISKFIIIMTAKWYNFIVLFVKNICQDPKHLNIVCA